MSQNVSEFSDLIKRGLSKLIPRKFLEVERMSDKMRKISLASRNERDWGPLKRDWGPLMTLDDVYERMRDQAEIGNTAVAIKAFLADSVKDSLISDGFVIEQFSDGDGEYTTYTIIKW